MFGHEQPKWRKSQILIEDQRKSSSPHFPGRPKAVRKVRESRPENSRGFNEARLSCIEQPSHDAGVCDRKRSSLCVMHRGQYTS